ncbi:hypothetical protein VTO42DRAFT_1583 [Malbranchea cinnamomea]
MTLLQNHLEQISASANAIAELPFPPPKMFANALLLEHEITTLIRDTEPHERALFSVDPNQQRRGASRRATMHPGEGEKDSMARRIYAAKNNRSQSVVAQVLGGDMMQRIQRSTMATTNRSTRGDFDIEVLLKGAEMLCNVYPIAGATEKIAALRHRYRELSESIECLEARVAEQSAQLERMNFNYDAMDDMEPPKEQSPHVTDEDIERELKEIRELEMRKQMLEDRVNGMERDIGGLLR